MTTSTHTDRCPVEIEGIPSFGRMHIPSCDFSALISPRLFEEFCLPMLQREVQAMMHNVFHVDSKGVATHIDMILDVPGGPREPMGAGRWGRLSHYAVGAIHQKGAGTRTDHR